MNQLTRLWTSLGRGQQVSLVLIPILCFAGLLAFTHWKHDSEFRVLYSSLAPEDAASVTQKMKEAGIEYKLDETGASVLVPVEHLAEARLALAGAGLPKSGRIGFELFDRNNLGTSDFAEQVNYRRALEGELERTVATLSEIEQARVHITFAKESVFLDSKQPSKATVVLRLRRSQQLSPGGVSAIANLIASAVDGLVPDSVAIIDSNGRLLNRPRAEGRGDVQMAEANLDYRQQVESALLAKIDGALSPLLGPERFRASVTADCDFTTSEQSEETYDAVKSALLTSQTTEESNGGTAATGGVPGTASNLPHPTARVSAGSAGLMRRTENVSYQPSRTVKRTVTPKGEIRKISVAVLLDQAVRWDGLGAKAKKTVIPPSAEMLKGVRDLVAGVTGFNEQRGDQLTVETLPFETTSSAEPPQPAGPPAVPLKTPLSIPKPFLIGGAAVLGLLVLVILGLLLRSNKGSRTAAVSADVAAALEAGEPAKGAVAGGLTSEQKVQQQITENEQAQSLTDAEALRGIKLPPNSRKTEVLIKHIRESVTKDPANATNVLRTWVGDLDARRL